LVRRCHRLGGQNLFSYRDGSGEPTPVTSTDVNEALQGITHLDVTAKDFRTWGGTVIVTEALSVARLGDADRIAIDDAVRGAIDEAAARLGNTRAVCRSSYVHPDLQDRPSCAGWTHPEGSVAPTGTFGWHCGAVTEQACPLTTGGSPSPCGSRASIGGRNHSARWCPPA